MTHHCHAEGCETPCTPARLMCPRHWRMVPRELQAAVWAAYEWGQETRKDPTAEYLAAAQAAVDRVAYVERTVGAARGVHPGQDRML